MDHHAGILQERVQVLSFLGRGNEPFEGIRREQDEEEEPDREQAHHAQDARGEALGQAMRQQRDSERPAVQHEHPEQDRALVRSPCRGETVMRGQFRVGMARHVEHGEIAHHERVGERGEGRGHEEELADGDGTRRRQDSHAPARRTGEREADCASASASATMRAK